MSMMIHGSGQRVAKFVRRTDITIARLIDLFPLEIHVNHSIMCIAHPYRIGGHLQS